MKRALGIILFVLFSAALHAQTVVDGITIPATHPALFFNSARLTTAQTWFGTHAFSCGGTDYLCLAFHDLVAGNNTNTTTVYNWASAYSMPVTGVACDNCRFDGEDLIMVFDWEYNNLTAGQRSTLITNYNAWISHWETQCFGGVIAEDSCTPANNGNMVQNNYYWGYTRNELEWGITSYNDQNSTAKGFLDDALTTRGTNAFQPTTTAGGNGAGGLPQEGDEYGRYEVWYPVIPFVTANFDGRSVYDEYDKYFKTTVCQYAYATSLNPMEVIIGGTDQSVSKWELFPFSDDELYQTNVGLAESPFSGIDGSGSYIGDFMNTMANYYSSIDIGKYAKQWLNNLTAILSTANHIASVDASSTAKAFSNLPLDYYATGNQYFYGHSSWATTNSTEFMMQMGSPTGIGHVHEDFGNWQMRRNGAAAPAYWGSRETVGYAQAYAPYGNPSVWAATHAYSINARVVPSPANGFAYQQIAANCTSGGAQPTFPTGNLATVSDGNCTWLNNTNGITGDRASVNELLVHNGVLMNGLGLGYASKQATPTVYRLETQANYSYADVDLTGSYRNTDGGHPERDNPSAAHVEREFVFVRPLETLVVLDRVLARSVTNGGVTLPAASINKTFVSHCEVAWTIEDASHERCDNGTQTLRTTSLLPPSFTQRTVTESTCVNSQSACSSGGQFRLELDSTDNCAQSYLLNVMQSRLGSGANLTASVVDSNSGCANIGSGTLTVTLHPSAGSDTTIVFNKATCSTTVPSQCSSGGTINVSAAGVTNLNTVVEGISYTDAGPVWAGTNGNGAALVPGRQPRL